MPGTRGSKRTKEQREQALALTSEYVRKGFELKEIAERLGVSVSQVKADINQLRKDWRETKPVDFDYYQRLQLETINMLMKEAWLAYEQSKQPFEVSASKSRKTGDAEVDATGATITTRRTEKRLPSDKFLSLIASLVKQRSELLGLNAPTQVQHSGTVTQINEIHYLPQEAAQPANVFDISESRRALMQPDDDEEMDDEDEPDT